MSDHPTSKHDSPSWLPWLVLLLLALTGIRTIAHPDYWTHLLQAQAPLKGTDNMVFSSQPEAVPTATWLYDRILSGLHGIGGEAASTLFHVGCVLAAFGLLIPVTLPLAGAGATSLALTVATWLLVYRFEPRAALLAMLPAAAFLHVLQKTSSMTTRLALLVPIQILWTNLHWSFLLGPLLVIGYCVADFLEARGQAEAHGARKTLPKQSLILCAACVLASLLNPWLFGLHAQTLSLHANLKDSVWATFGSAAVEVLQHVVMHPFWSQYGDGPGGPIPVCLAIGALGLVLFRDKLPWGLTIAAASASFLIVQQYALYREIFAIVTFPFLALAIRSITSFLAEKIKQEQPVSLAVTALSLAGSLFLAASVLNNSIFLRYGTASSAGLGLAQNGLPAGLISVLEDEGAPDKILTTPVLGSFLASQLAPERVAIDARVHLHRPSSYGAIYQALADPNGEKGRKHLQEWDPDGIVVDLQNPLAGQFFLGLMQVGWRPAYMDGLALLMVKQSAVESESATAWMKKGLAELNEASQAIRESGGAPIYAPLPLRCLGGAKGLIAMGALKQADSLLDDVENGIPVVRGLALTRGIAKLGADDAEKAIFYLEIADRQTPDNPRTLGLLAAAYTKAGRKAEADAINVRLKAMKEEMSQGAEAE